METQGIQINKFISSTGFCSRREADKLVEQGRVTLNGKLALPTSRVNEKDRVAVDDEVIKVRKSESLYIAFNKPKGITSTTDEKDRTSITAFISHSKRIFPIGRLDKDSEGLILLTDDGDIVNKVLRAGNEHEKEYIVTVDKPVTPEFIKAMSGGVAILDTVTKPCKVSSFGNKKFKIILTQGLNRQIRRMCEVLGYKVSELRRVRIMHIKLDDLPLGKWRKLNAGEIERMNEFVRDSSKTSFPLKRNKEFEGKNAGYGAKFKKGVKSFEGDKSQFKPDSKFKRAPRFNADGKTPARKESKFIRPFKPGDKVLKEAGVKSAKDNTIKYPSSIENKKNRFSKAQAKSKYAKAEAGKELLYIPKVKAKAKSKFVLPEPKDKLTLKKEAGDKYRAKMEVKAKQSSRKNFNTKPNKRKSGK